jgi:glycosyltransferase involved in cell wall biosynthesis
LLAPPGDADALADRLATLLADAPLRRNLALNGRRVIEDRFDRRLNFARLKALLEAAASGSALPEGTPELNPDSIYDASCVR